MRKPLLFICMMGLSLFIHASSGTEYLNRFMAYMQWSQNLPTQPDSEFLAFIDSDTPLAQKLREKWLYQLARQKNWQSYTQHYKPSKDISLQCYALIADYQQGKQQQALQAAKPLWLNGTSQPPACNDLFNLLLKNESFDERLITERIKLALDKRNLGLARYLLKQYKQPRLKDEQLLISIYQSPARITQLEPGELHDIFYLFGLKRMVSTNMDQAIKLSQTEKTKKMLNHAQQQAFLAHVALYKAMRNHEDANHWFAKVQPAYYNDVLLDWQIRYALKRQEWAQVERLVNYSQDKDSPCWQYWLARALEARGERAKANAIYQSVAKSRHYYGFLASLRLNKSPNFENEPPVNDMSILKPYQPFTDNIKSLYLTKQSLQASRLLNEFVIELPKEDKSALAYWIANDLQWHGKSVYLSNTEEDLNNQLMLRFPLAYRMAISEYSKNYHIPQELIYAIIRQESGFREDVVSPAGARGLMQLMPTTASQVAKRERISYADKAQLFLSQKNINIGVAYLKQLANHYGHPLLVAAAYNAGPRQVNFWLKNHPPKQIDIWIETLPWQETRNYLKNVIAFYTVYQYRMQTRPDLRAFMRPL
ncbi:soluble lytic murein transglycosylase [Legionella lansingensis]|uniref:Soluble lytic murein transglycosylase n=1 Tax=Legionella lansingensis TaxID=45067 RepID=A0A0W0VMP3_9GAMM|nr:lytic transglycosylase domain-containing protein [Legionella lansingensis]KTD21410.1 soluble lytic murein transglycosylase [Legionella lansingensis]SNV51931.1 soluble lytic murein transglycosylase [Legionella lansingensis]